ncbi:MAG: hypothetical protein UT94_C0002G0011 [Candidatus Uhrbacteria bacterium GW2011_GWF2_40_263]|nr:MAG: hypothetical protein UT94_C0002G0011 [Candidatus Uhrbacteria bacterium GW2011_GWF2_40_263]
MKKMKEKKEEKENKTTEETVRIPLLPEEVSDQQHTEAPSLNELTWRIFRIMSEFVEGFQFLSESHQEVTIFGSARFPEDHRWYKEARKLGNLLAEHGFTVITGGGPGIMEAANRGAFEKGGESIGLNIQLPTEQRINQYVKRGRGFHYFFTRKVMLAASAQAYIYFPGGFGTLDEMFEIITLIQTKKMQKIPVVLIGKSYWDPLWSWVMTELRDVEKTVAPDDLKLVQIVDTAEEAFDLIKDSQERTLF